MRIEVLHEPRLVDDDGTPIALRPRTARLLALLAVHHPSWLSTPTAVDGLWPVPPLSASKGIQNAVVELRRHLGPQAVERSSLGYRLGGAVPMDLVEVRAACRSDVIDDLARALEQLDDPLLPFADDDASLGERARLEFLRMDTEERVVDLLLASAQPDSAVQHAVVFAHRHPARERRWIQLATALVRCGRRRDALQAVRHACTVLGETYGLEPCQELVDLEHRILALDPTLLLDERSAEQQAVESLDAARLAADERDPSWFRLMLDTAEAAGRAGTPQIARAAGLIVAIPDTGLGTTSLDLRRAAVAAAAASLGGSRGSGDDPATRIEHARLLANQALTSLDADADHLAWQQARAMEALDLVQDLAREAEVPRGDPAAIGGIILSCHSALLGPRHRDVRVACTATLVDLARRIPEPSLVAAAASTAILDAADVGDLVVLDRWLGTLDEIREQLPLLGWQRETVRAARCVTQGRFRDAIEAADRALAAPGARNHPVAPLIHVAQLHYAHDPMGTVEEVRHLLAPLLPRLDHALGDPLLALEHLRDGQAAAAADLLTATAARSFRDVTPNFTFLANLARWADLSYMLGDQSSAAVLVELLTPFDGWFTPERTANLGAPVALHLGRLHSVLRNDDAAFDTGRRAVLATRRARADHLLAVCLVALAAGVLRDHAAPDDRREAARAAALEAQSIADGNGARYWARRAAELASDLA